MKCDLCHNDATVHEVLVRDGQRFERTLCESCAQKAGLTASSMSLPEALAKLTLQPDADATQRRTRSPRPKIVACPGCGLTFDQFRKSGLLGCPACYKAMEAMLLPLIERAHEGAVQHVGKGPKRLLAGLGPDGPGADVERLAREREREERIKVLRRQLQQAVASEQYENAVRLRDQLRQLGAMDVSTASGMKHKPPGPPPAP